MVTREELRDLKGSILDYMKEMVISDAEGIVEYLKCKNKLKETIEVPNPRSFACEVLGDMAKQGRLYFTDGTYSLPLKDCQRYLDHIKNEMPNFLLDDLRLRESKQIAKQEFFDHVERKYGNKITKNPCILQNDWKTWLEDVVISPLVDKRDIRLEPDKNKETWIVPGTEHGINKILYRIFHILNIGRRQNNRRTEEGKHTSIFYFL